MCIRDRCDVFGFENLSPTKKVAISGATVFQLPRHHRLHSRRFSIAKRQQRCARTRVLCRRLGAMMRGVWSIVKKTRIGGVTRAPRLCSCSWSCAKSHYRYLNGNFLLRLGWPFPAFNLRNGHFSSDSDFNEVGYRLFFLT